MKKTFFLLLIAVLSSLILFGCEQQPKRINGFSIPATYDLNSNGFYIPIASGLEWELERRINPSDVLSISNKADTLDEIRAMKLLDQDDRFMLYPAGYDSVGNPTKSWVWDRNKKESYVLHDSMSVYFIQINGQDIGYLINSFSQGKVSSVYYNGLIPKYRNEIKICLSFSVWSSKVNKDARNDFNRVHLVRYNPAEKLWREWYKPTKAPIFISGLFIFLNFIFRHPWLR